MTSSISIFPSCLSSPTSTCVTKGADEEATCPVAFVSMHPGDLRLLSQPWLWSSAGEDNKVTAFTERLLSARHCAQRSP